MLNHDVAILAGIVAGHFSQAARAMASSCHPLHGSRAPCRLTRVTQVKRTQTSAQICYGLTHRPILHKPGPCQISENTCPRQGSLDTSKRALKSQISENTCPRQGSIYTSKRSLKIQISENMRPRQGSIDTSKRSLKTQVLHSRPVTTARIILARHYQETN